MKLKQTALSFVVVVCTAFLVAVSAQQGADWPQWRGVNRDGSATFSIPASWPEQLTRKWKVDVGLGYATPLLVGNRIYLFSRQGGNEVMSAIDPDSGKTIWQTAYPASFTMNSAAAKHE